MEGLCQFLALLREDKAPIVSIDKVQTNSREAGTKELAGLLDAACKR